MPDVGDSRTATLTVTPADGTTAATVLITKPDASTDTPAVSGSLAGSVWTGSATVDLDLPGWWLAKWTATGTGEGVEYQQFYVSGAPPIPDDAVLVCSLEQFKGWLKFPLTDNTQDDKLLICLASATAWIRWRQSGPVAVETFVELLWCNGRYMNQSQHPLQTVVSVTPQDAGALSSTAYRVDTTNSFIEMRGASYGWHDVVYTAGPSKVRPHVRLAGQEVARHLWTIQNGSSGRGFPGDEYVATPMGFAVPRRAEEMMAADPDNTTMPGFA